MSASIQIRRTSRPVRPGGAARAVAAIALLALAGCASDAWRPNPQISGFMNQVERYCGTARIGELTVSQLMSPSSPMSSAYFVDMTSKLENGRVTPEEYATGISSTFNTVRDSAGIRCILDQKAKMP